MILNHFILLNALSTIFVEVIHIKVSLHLPKHYCYIHYPTTINQAFCNVELLALDIVKNVECHLVLNEQETNMTFKLSLRIWVQEGLTPYGRVLNLLQLLRPVR